MYVMLYVMYVFDNTSCMWRCMSCMCLITHLDHDSRHVRDADVMYVTILIQDSPLFTENYIQWVLYFVYLVVNGSDLSILTRFLILYSTPNLLSWVKSRSSLSTLFGYFLLAKCLISLFLLYLYMLGFSVFLKSLITSPFAMLLWNFVGMCESPSDKEIVLVGLWYILLRSRPLLENSCDL